MYSDVKLFLLMFFLCIASTRQHSSDYYDDILRDKRISPSQNLVDLLRNNYFGKPRPVNAKPRVSGRVGLTMQLLGALMEEKDRENRANRNKNMMEEMGR